MLISYSMPGITSSSITGAGWLTSDGADALYDGKPARRARLQWGAGATLDAYVQIALGFGAATPLRVLALLGTTLPAGVRVDFLGAGGDGLGGTCNNARTATMPDGTTGAWAVARDNEPAETGCWIRIHNDCNGAPWAVNGTIVDLGEVWAGPAVTAGIRDGWDVQTVDPGEVVRTRGGQVNVARQSSYRSLAASFAGLSASAVRGEGLANGMDLERVTAALRGGARCAVVPHYRSLTTRALDPQAIARSAIYGYAAQLPNASNITRGWFTGQLVVEEIPAR